MRDFTSPEYIKPVITDILSNYTPDFSLNEYFRCICIMNRNGSNEGFMLKDNQDWTNRLEPIMYSNKALELHKAIEDYAEAVETYETELFYWTISEQKRADQAIINALIQTIQEGRKTA